MDNRSTATTILAVRSLIELQRDRNLATEARKLLSFTDNRQDASLQAGHFNDFVQVALLRSALYRACAGAGDPARSLDDSAVQDRGPSAPAPVFPHKHALAEAGAGVHAFREHGHSDQRHGRAENEDSVPDEGADGPADGPAGGPGLRHGELSRRVLDAMHPRFEDYAADPDVRGPARQHTRDALRRVIEYFLYRDLERGWRVTAPNLEDCGLLRFGVRGAGRGRGPARRDGAVGVGVLRTGRPREPALRRSPRGAPPRPAEARERSSAPCSTCSAGRSP